MNTTTDDSVSPEHRLHPELVDALTQFETAVTTLTKITDPQLGRFGDQPLVIMEFARRFELVRLQLGQVDHHLVGACETAQVASRLSQRTTATLLANSLQLSAADAGRRVRAAGALTARTTMTGTPIEPIRPVLGRAVSAGTVSVENADITLRCLDTLTRVLGVQPQRDPDQTAELLDQAEHDLTVHATVLRPEDLRTACQRLIECYDPDGQEERDRHQDQLRELRLVAHRDGGYSITGRLTGTLGAQLLALLSPLARPRSTDPGPDDVAAGPEANEPEPDTAAGTGTATTGGAGSPGTTARNSDTRNHSTATGDPGDPGTGTATGDPGTCDSGAIGTLTGHTRTQAGDPGRGTGTGTVSDAGGQTGSAGQPRRRQPGDRDLRTSSQRWHDAFADLIDRVARAGGLPVSGGTPATVIITIDLEDLLNRTGYGSTSDGMLLSAADVLRLADEADVRTAYTTRTGSVLAMGRACRIANRTQTLALIARDAGCTFPGCDHPPEWCQRHHIRSWLDGGPTDVDNLTLVCGYHHRSFDQRGWTCTMIKGLPHWTPPEWIDPQRRPLLNHRLQAPLRTAHRSIETTARTGS